MEIFIFILTVFAVARLLTNFEAATSHFWQLFITLLSAFLKLIGFFKLLDFGEKQTEKLYFWISNADKDKSIFNREESWTNKFLTLYNCMLCTGFWVGISLSFLTDINFYSDLHTLGHVLTGATVSVTSYYLYELTNRVLYT